jgi:upstream activation factor subunit UAF30
MAPKKKSGKKAAARKPAAKKSAKKATKKSAAKRGGSKTAGRGGAKKSTAKRGAAKKSTAKKATAKRGAVKKAAPKRAAKKATKKSATKRAPNPAFMKAMTPSGDLAQVIGNQPQPRTEITKKVWAYIKKNNLQDAKERRMINADDKLRRVFGGKNRVSMFEMTKLVNNHLK